MKIDTQDLMVQKSQGIGKMVTSPAANIEDRERLLPEPCAQGAYPSLHHLEALDDSIGGLWKYHERWSESDEYRLV